jgi:murein DD-endopeptidase MepM/ murein hydrolase activator NlpD
MRGINRVSVTLLVTVASLATLAPARPHAEAPPFRLPFNSPPGPSTWFLGQPFGNTTSAFLFRDTWYSAGQGLHFGVDFTAPCGTEVVAIGDGTVFKIDAREHGAGPHNLLIRHEALGLMSLYGHLLERPRLNMGQKVQRGSVVGLSGDPDESCTSRPHLHLEIRNLALSVAYNPIPLIQADWDSLALVGQPGSGFQYDLRSPRRWQFLDDQPDIEFGELPLNDYAAPWPPGWRGFP